jgi:uncharacterized protein YbjT (DUF2867 family)
VETKSEGTTLVLGGTGKTGSRVAGRLGEIGLVARIGSRAGEPPFDWEDTATWGPVLDGVRSVYVTYQPDLAAPSAADRVGSFADLAVRRGVRRLVLLSGRGEPEAGRGEEAVKQSGAEWTVLRSSFFAQNFSESFFLGPVLEGELALPVGEVAEPFVDAGDVADVAVAALSEEGHGGEIYELTGPRLLTFPEAVDEISRATGREIRYVPVSTEEFASALRQEGVPPEVVQLLSYLFAEVLDGRNAYLTDGVRRALGREPTDFADFARRTAASGKWAGPHIVKLPA